MIRRLYYTSTVLNGTKKQGMKLCKMLNPKGKRHWYPSQSIETNMMPSLRSLTKTKNEPDNRGVRRIAVLNKLFMKYITDIMSTGTVSMNIVGRGIEISKVKVTPDFMTVNVYWICKGQNSDTETEKLLNNIAGPLRHELSNLRLMGEIPYITFVKDKLEAQIIDIDRRLAEADFGEDYTPTEMGQILKSEFTLDTKLSPEMKARIKMLEDAQEVIEDTLPEMTNSVFGLDHTKIMNRLLAVRKKTKDAWTNLEAKESPVISYRKEEVAPSNIDNKKQKQELSEFLLKRQILQNKLQKQRRDRTVSTATYEVDIDEKEEDVHEFCDDYRDDYVDDYSDLDRVANGKVP